MYREAECTWADQIKLFIWKEKEEKQAQDLNVKSMEGSMSSYQCIFFKFMQSVVVRRCTIAYRRVRPQPNNKG